MKRIVVAGGGIAGLACAHRLLRLREERGLDIEVTLLEASRRLGGKVMTDRSSGIVIEAGPDSFITLKGDGVALACELGLGERLLSTGPGSRDVYVYARRRLRRLPDGLLLMAPSKPLPFLASDIMSWRGKLRMGMELLVPRRRPGPGEGSDESLASFARRRLGQEALDTIVEPLMAGIFAADAETLSLENTFPQFLEMEKRHRSIILGLRAAAKKAKPPAGGLTAFVSFIGGTDEIVEGLRGSVGDAARTGARVRRVARDGSAWRVETDADPVRADAVVLAIPCQDAAAALEPEDAALAGLMREIASVSTATLTLGFKPSDIPPLPRGYGFVVAKAAGLSINAATFTSQKFARREYALSVIRCFFGGAGREEQAEAPEERLLEGALADLRATLGISAAPQFAKLFRWLKANPQYNVGHKLRIARIEERLAAHPNLWLAGDSYYGVGIPDCARSGRAAAEKACAALLSS